MKRRIFTFATWYAGAHKNGVKAIRGLTGRRPAPHQAASRPPITKTSPRSSPLLRTGAALCLAIALGLPAIAQRPATRSQMLMLPTLS